jgi:hypothetical protein
MAISPRKLPLTPDLRRTRRRRGQTVAADAALHRPPRRTSPRPRLPIAGLVSDRSGRRATRRETGTELVLVRPAACRSAQSEIARPTHPDLNCSPTRYRCLGFPLAASAVPVAAGEGLYSHGACYPSLTSPAGATESPRSGRSHRRRSPVALGRGRRASSAVCRRASSRLQGSGSGGRRSPGWSGLCRPVPARPSRGR